MERQERLSHNVHAKVCICARETERDYIFMQTAAGAGVQTVSSGYELGILALFLTFCVLSLRQNHRRGSKAIQIHGLTAQIRVSVRCAPLSFC